MPILSIIIVTYNSGDIVFDVLRSAVSAIKDIDAEIIIVDNQSQDGVPQRVAEVFPEVQLIVSPENRGFATANNIGLAAAKGAFLVLLNPDVLVEVDAFRTLISFMQQNKEVGVVGPRTFDAHKQVTWTAHVPFSAWGILWQYCGLSRLFPYRMNEHYRKQCETSTEPFEAAWVQAHCLLMRREVYDQIGGLDDKLFLFAEEPDFCDRATQAGWKVMFIPQAQVTHFESTSISRYPLIKMRHYHISPLYYFFKRQRRSDVRVLKIGFTLELFVKFLVRLFQFRWIADQKRMAQLKAYPIVIQEVWRYSQ